MNASSRHPLPAANRPSVSLRDIRKLYRLYARPSDRLVEWMTGRSRHRALLALDGITFDIEKGTVLGLIGENGAGKSTLLKIVAGVSEPTSGDVQVRGAVASILELGAGFHGDFTGRENARLNAAILGVSAEYVEETLARTKEFSELDDFFERPVRTYSSGMVMRLAFTIATEVDPEVLIIDEALAVGDGHFQKKSVDRIAAFKDAGKTILFCSHAMYFVTTLCDRAVWLAEGRMARMGEAPDVVREYENFLQAKNGRAGAEAGVDGAGFAERNADSLPPIVFIDHGESMRHGPEGSTGRLAWIETARVIDALGRERSEFSPGEEIQIEVTAASRRPETGLHVRIGIDRADGVQVFANDTRRDGQEAIRGSLRHRIVYRIPTFPVRNGEFSVFVYLGDDTAMHLYDHVLLRGAIRVRSESFDVGILEIPREWSAEPLP